MARLRAQQDRLLRKSALECSHRGTAAGSVVMFIFVAVLACGKDTPPPTPAPLLSQVEGPVQSRPQPAAHIASLPPVLSQVEESEEKGAPFDGSHDRLAMYQSRGRCDPFRPPRKLMGIIWGAHSSYALMEWCSSPGMGYVIRENDEVEPAKAFKTTKNRVVLKAVKITKDSVVFEVQTKNLEGKLLTRSLEKHMLPAETK